MEINGLLDVDPSFVCISYGTCNVPLSINVPKFAFIQIGIFARASLECGHCSMYDSLFSFSSVRTMH